MFDKTRKNINQQTKKVKDTNHHYSKLGRNNAKEVLRSRKDEHKDEYIRPSQYYEQYAKNRRDDFKRTSLIKKVAIIIAILLVALIILIGAFG